MTRLIEAPACGTSLARGATFTRASWPLLIACAAGCHKLDDDDHRLRETGGLFSLYADASEACVPCLREYCRDAAIACADNPGCTKAVQCQSAAEPGAYRDCLTELYDMDASTPDDRNGSWEGDKGDYGSCVEEHCKTQCKRDQSDWSCTGWDGITAYTSYELVLSVRILGISASGFTAAPGVIVQTCTRTQGCVGSDVTDDAGTRTITVYPAGSSNLHFKIIPGDSGIDFPTSYYYPAHLGSRQRQPMSIHLIATHTINIAHLVQGLPGVLSDVAQALILPDGCREQSLPSATEVTVHLEGQNEQLTQCWGDAIKDGSLQSPCVWYAGVDGFPKAGLAHTLGMGAGVLGLAGGVHVLRICDRDSKRLLARREVYMEPGALTVARTWPLTEEEIAAVGDDCFPIPAPPE